MIAALVLILLFHILCIWALLEVMSMHPDADESARPLTWCRDGDVFWFRVFGRGLWFGRSALHPPLFSERYGHRKVWRVFGWKIMVLTP